MILETCVESYSEAFLAWKSGADRIELCENLAVGGTTPSYGTIKLSCATLGIPVVAMIRPRGGDFVYSESEFRIMQHDIKICKQLNCKGVVFGMLTEKNEIDKQRIQILVELAHPMEVVFHKAFDELESPFKGLEQLIDLGFDRILTSGTKTTALEGQEIIRNLITQASGRIGILVAGKVTWENLAQIQATIPANEFHGKRIVRSVKIDNIL